MKKGFYILLIIISMFAFAFVATEVIRKCERAINESQPTSVSLTVYELGQKLEDDTTALNKYLDKYLELEGVLIGFPEFEAGHRDVHLTSGLQTDTGYLVGQPVYLRSIIRNGPRTPCDSFMLSYGTLYNLQESSPKILVIANIFNFEGDTLLNNFYYPVCDSIRSHGRHDYMLANFCREKVRIKGMLTSVERSGQEFTVYLNRGVVLSRSKIDKKAIFKDFPANL